jgi:hypothetical protein
MKDSSPRDFNLSFPLYVDEGIMAAGGERALPYWADVIKEPKASFRNSADVAGIQLADFAAFVIPDLSGLSSNEGLGPRSADPMTSFCGHWQG